MSTGLRMKQSKVYYDSDSDSDFDPVSEENKGQHDNSTIEPQQGNEEECPWRPAVDPNSGKTYYYHMKTRETQWQMPIEMASREERAALAAKERRQKDFFAAMEANIMKSISEGYKAPEKSSSLDREFGHAIISDDPLPISTATATGSSRQLSPRKGRLERTFSNGSSRSRPNLVRTISSMDTNVLRELIKRVPSSRQVRQGKPLPSGSSSSNRSYGSTNHTRQARFGGLSGRTMGARQGSAAPGRQKPTSIFDRKDAAEQDDNEIPPLTVVTTPDLRKRESLGMDALIAQDPRDLLTRRDSLTIDQLSFSGRGNLVDSRYFDQSAGSRLTMSNNSFSLEANDSGRFMGPVGGGSQSRLSRGGGGYAGSHSFNSLASSESQHSLSQGMDASQNGMSVCSIPLMPVEEGHDESEYSNPRLATGGNQQFLGGETNLLGEGSFSFGAESDGQGDTADWLGALPSDASANREEIVGYGNDAKRFSDAGFTSFFDESMANFDLSDKETQALQKLAMISEQMTKVTEAEESDETEESEEIDDDDDDMPDLNEAGSDFPLFLESSEDEEASDEEPSSQENEGTQSPSIHTPTSGTMKTTGTSSTTTSPVRKPVRGLGPKTSRIPRSVRNKQIREASLNDDDSNSTRGSLSADGSLAVSKLALASATLTIDNARSHDAPQMSLTVDNPRSHISENQPQRRHVGDIHWSPPKNDELSNSASSLNSANSIAMANAARRLSMFRLKGIDRSRLRVTGDGKGNSPESDAKSVQTQYESGAPVDDLAARPNLVRRNTCGTLYVGTTMSAPDKDATIKCVCGVYRAHILQAEMEDEPADTRYRIFNDLESQQGTGRGKEFRRRPSTLPIPALEQITTFYRDVFQRAQMEYDCIIISLIYVERLIKTTNGGLRPRACNWRSILFSCMVLASKVWDDLSMWNKDFSQTCPNGVKFPLKRINELEVAILSSLSYKVKVPASEYAKYYFLLRSMLIKSGLVGDNVDTTTPLDVEGAKRLQQVSTQFQSGMGAARREMRKAKSMRSRSMGEDERARVGAGARRAKVKNKKVSLEHIVTM